MGKFTSILKYVLLALSVVALVSVFFLGADRGTDVMLIWAYVLTGLAVVISLVFPLVNLLQNPKGAVRALIGLVVAAVVIGISYALSDVSPIRLSNGNLYTDTAGIRLTDIGLYVTYFVLGATVLAIFIGEIRNSVK